MAWQPFTPRGVSAFAGASFGRLLLVQLVIALIVAGVAVWFVQARWFPVVSGAIRKLPGTGTIQSGRLAWRGDSPVLLAEGRWLAFTIDLRHQGEARSPAHLQIELGERDWQLRSLLGFLSFHYPKSWSVALDRAELEPWWGAWVPPLLAMTALGTIAGLLLSWTLLATLYFLPVWLISFFANRDLSLGGSWRLAGAALMPGAAFMTLALIAYGFAALDLVRLLAAGVLHFLIGWVWLGLSFLWLPRHAAATLRSNPFARGH